MLLSSALTLCFAVIGAVATPLERRAKAQVVTKCTVPNTVALTFVSAFTIQILSHPNF